MSKELEALERIKEWYPQWHLYNREDFNILKLALMNREVILKERDSIYQVLNKHHIKSLSELDEQLCYAEQIKFEDNLKLIVLEIIKEKVSDIGWFKCCSSVEDYNGSVPSYKQLTKEEYEILREVLTCQQ